jgi:hypothetical protein
MVMSFYLKTKRDSPIKNKSSEKNLLFFISIRTSQPCSEKDLFLNRKKRV